MARLSEQIEAAIPQMMLVAIGRKLAALCVKGMGLAFTCTPIAKREFATSFARAYTDVKAWFDAAWSCAYFLVLLYAVYDVVTNLGDFVHCRPHNTPRPIGVFSAVALVCFTFTTRLSASSISLVAMLCARQHNMLTGLAACVNVAAWSNQNGAGVLLALCGMLSLLHYVFCGTSSSAALFATCAVWVGVWSWLTVIEIAFEARSKSKRE